MTSKTPEPPCPCGGGRYADCCAPYHTAMPAPNAEALMRSRYSAYVLQLEPYLLATWHPSTRPSALDLVHDKTQWIDLKIVSHTSQSEQTAKVEFIARYKLNGRAKRLHEISAFVRENGRWFYVDGIFPD